jgi:hypothetical protein
VQMAGRAWGEADAHYLVCRGATICLVNISIQP